MKTKVMTLSALFAALTAVGAWCQFQLGAIPFSLQVIAIYTVGAVCGMKIAFYSQAIYILTGLIGLPVFTAGGGLWYVTHPTFGFLIGFLLAAVFIGWFSDKGLLSKYFNVFSVLTLGIFIIYLFGCTYYYFVLNVLQSQTISPQAVFTAVFLTGIPGDMILIVISSYVIVKVRQQVRVMVS